MPERPRRVSVVGSSGSGKTTVARRLAAELDVPHVELDALHWGPGWSAASPAELSARIAEATAGEAWVVDGNYWGKVGPQVWERADTVVWVSPPRWRTTWQSVTRTLRRVVTRQELWNGNRERWSGLAFWRGEDSVLWWAWTTYDRTQERYAAAMADPQWAHLTFHRLRTRRDVEHFLAGTRRAG
ncbi:AAA family ATPase [Nocardioides perillae]|uniref:Adenylate kinase family enzyme n=1 Tax=Nocardioides perillae TaxID=1119534 RepID=A0A7Y9UVF2_9ACTN|nr:adenylate kinase family enzyme [Nocardioides perillae]